MSGSPRDLAAPAVWQESLERSRTRRRTSSKRRVDPASAKRPARPALDRAVTAARAEALHRPAGFVSAQGVASRLPSPRRLANDAASQRRFASDAASRRLRVSDAASRLPSPRELARDLAETDPWELSALRSRTRRRASELRFVPTPTRARRVSLGTLAALAAGPAVGLATADGPGGGSSGGTAAPEPTTETHRVVAHGARLSGAAAPTKPTSGARGQGNAGLANGSANASAGAAEQGPSSVERLQRALHVTVDGSYGPETAKAVRAFQSRHGLAMDGVVGSATWHALGLKETTILQPPPTPKKTPAAHGAARAHASARAHVAVSHATAHESRGDAIVKLQEALGVSTDGTLGPETEAAIRKAQAKHGLTVDGVVGSETWHALGLKSHLTLHPPHASRHSSTSGGSGGGSSNSSGESSDTSSIVARVIAAADEIATRPYVYGGGHGSFQSSGYDCSGSVSYALHGGGLLSSPEDSGELESYGDPGPGQHITIYANAEHAWMTIDGRRFDTIAQQETGTRWSDSMMSTAGYVVRHPPGL